MPSDGGKLKGNCNSRCICTVRDDVGFNARNGITLGSFPL